MSRKIVKVKLLKSWLGNPAGCFMTIFEDDYEKLAKRGIVRLELERRSVGRPPKDKMVSSPEVEK